MQLIGGQLVLLADMEQSKEPNMVETQKAIYRLCHTLDEAERFQFRLYSKYDSVQLVKAPMFDEFGIYSWRVSGRKLAK